MFSSNFSNTVFQKLEDFFSNFPKFRKAVFQFLNFTIIEAQTIFWCLIFLGKMRIMDIEHFAIFWTLRSFPKNIKHPKIFYICNNSEIRKFEDGFSKFWKIRKAIFQILEYSKNWKRLNEWCLSDSFCLTFLPKVFPQ